MDIFFNFNSVETKLIFHFKSILQKYWFLMKLYEIRSSVNTTDDFISKKESATINILYN